MTKIINAIVLRTQPKEFPAHCDPTTRPEQKFLL